MKSTARIKSHPIHPILVGFPITFFVAALLLDVAALFTGNPLFPVMAYYADGAGVVSGLVAAIPGIIDYICSVPPRSSGKSRAMTHGLLNSVVILLFITAFFMRRGDAVSLPVILALEAAGVIGVSISGWLGGTLVYRNQVGVDHRYAGAGKWKEKTFPVSGNRIEIPSPDQLELNVNQAMLIRAGGRRIVLARTENGYAAFDDHCTHRGGSLADGAVICGTVQCPWHGSQFDVHTGAVKAGPAKESIKVYRLVSGTDKLVVEL